MTKKSPLRIKEPEPVKRLPYRIATGLHDRLGLMAQKHLPQPTKTVFIEFILNMGMDAYGEETMLEKPYNYDGKEAIPYKMPYFFKAATIERLTKIAKKHEPRVSRRAFTEYILHLGMQRYYKEYTVYGFKKD